VKHDHIPPAAVPTTLQDVIDRLAGGALSDTRKRDLRSAVVTYGKLVGRAPAAVPLDLADIRSTLDGMVPAQAKVSRKRWANLRSDLAAAFDASGLRPMLRTADVELDGEWSGLFQAVTHPRLRNGLSRFARWASLRRITPAAVNDAAVARFVAELEASSLIRNLGAQHRSVALLWNMLCTRSPVRGMSAVAVPASRLVPTRVPWEQLPACFRAETDAYLAWCAMPDPLDEQARARALAPLTLGLRRGHIHSAVTAASGAGIDADRLTSLAKLTEPEVFRALLRHRWGEDGRTLSAYTHGMAGTLIAIASEWVKVPADVIATLKQLRSKLGTLPSGLTEKNKALLRQFDDVRLCEMLVELPDRLWQRARRDLAKSRRPFIDLQSALAIDLLIHAPLRMENLSSLNFNEHLHWTQGRGKPALIVFRVDETKNDTQLEFEIPKVLADRLQLYRNEIAPAVTGKRPDAVFVTWAGGQRTQAAIATAIERTVLRLLGVKLTPHQFRHLAAKINLDANPGAYELVRQLLGHKNMKTTTNFYAGIDTRRAGRAHADLIMKLRETKMGRGRHRPTPRPRRRKD
jgi:site-specific recombinase XerC